MVNVFKRILNVNIERRYYAKGVDEEVIRLYPEFKHMAELSQQERMAIIREEWGKIKELDETEEVKGALKAIYEALGRLENPEAVFKNASDYADTVLSKDHLETVEEIEAEEVVEVETKENKGTVVIEETAELVSANFKYDKDFIKVVKGLGFEWDGDTWTKIVPATIELAYIINKFMKEGFNVTTSNHKALEMIKNKELDKATGRYITIKNNKFLLMWREYSKELYNEARRIPTSEWTGHGVSVDFIRVNEVIEYARIHNFVFVNCSDKLEELALKKIIIDPVTSDELSKEEVFEMLPDLIEE